MRVNVMFGFACAAGRRLDSNSGEAGLEVAKRRCACREVKS